MVGPADLVGSRYRLQEEIRSDKASTLFLATDEAEGRSVVVEVGRVALAPESQEVIRRRARAAAALTHPGIAPVLDAGAHEDRVFVVSELVRGSDLGSIAGGSPVPAARAVGWSLEILKALEHAHEAGIAHGDLRTTKVVLTVSGRVKIMGFAAIRTHPGRDDPASDLVAVGRILDDLLGGDAREDPIPEQLESILARATALDPSQRYRSATEMAGALAEIPLETLDPLQAAEVDREPRPSPTVWPIPGTRYDPTALGKRVIAIAIVVALIALAAFAWRVASRISERESAPAPTPPASNTTTSDASLEANLRAGTSVRDRDHRASRVTLISVFEMPPETGVAPADLSASPRRAKPEKPGDPTSGRETDPN